MTQKICSFSCGLFHSKHKKKHYYHSFHGSANIVRIILINCLHCCMLLIYKCSVPCLVLLVALFVLRYSVYVLILQISFIKITSHLVTTLNLSCAVDQCFPARLNSECGFPVSSCKCDFIGLMTVRSSRRGWVDSLFGKSMKKKEGGKFFLPETP